MKELYLKRKQLCDTSMNLRTLKFDPTITKEEVNNLIRKQNEVYKKWKFYDNYIKIGGKIKSEILHTKEG